MIKDIAIENLNKENFDLENKEYSILEIAQAIIKEYESNEAYYNLEVQKNELDTVAETYEYLNQLSNRN